MTGKRLASEVECDVTIATAQAVWALIIGQRHQIEGLAALMSGTAPRDQNDFYRVARQVSKASRQAIDANCVRLLVMQDTFTVKNARFCSAFVSRKMTEDLVKLGDEKMLRHSPVSDGAVADFIRSFGFGRCWIIVGPYTISFKVSFTTVESAYIGDRQWGFDFKTWHKSMLHELLCLSD